MVRPGARGRGVQGGDRGRCRRSPAGRARARRRGDAAGHDGRRGGRDRARARTCQASPPQGGLMDIRFLGHAAFELSDGDTRVLVDPFLSGNPKAAVGPDEVDPSTILLTHGHADHIGDTVDIAKRSGAPVVAIVELAQEIGQDDVEVFDPNLGGTVKFDWGWVKLVPAWHTSTTPKGTVNTPAGLLIDLGGRRVYHLGDTCLFSDLQLVKRYGRIDAAIMPIGGHYTMDRFDAVVAAEWVGADPITPCHYGTFPPIETDAQAFKSDVQNAGAGEVVVMSPGDTHTL